MSKSRLERHVENIPEWKKKWLRSLTRINMSISKAVREKDISKEELADGIDRSEEWVDRMLGGGINLSMKTIAKLEDTLDTELVNFDYEPEEEPEKRRRRTNE